MMAIAPRFWRKSVDFAPTACSPHSYWQNTAANNFSRPILAGRSWAPTTMISQAFCFLLLYIPT
jgi:hypothetical protein